MKKTFLRNMALPHSFRIFVALVFLSAVVRAEGEVFLETFDAAATTPRNSYTATKDAVCDVSSWNGENFVIKNPATKDPFVSGRILKTQGKVASFWMTTDKADGCGSISLYHGLQQGNIADVTWVLSVSTDQGQTWNAYCSQAISPTTTFEQITFTDVNLSGNIRIRVDVNSPNAVERYACFDNIQITDYPSSGGSEAPDPPEEPGDPEDPPVDPEPTVTALDIRSGKTVRETFDSLEGTKEADLPLPWRVSSATDMSATELPYAAALLKTTQYAGTNVSIKTAGIYNIGAGNRDTATDRAVGFLSSGSNFRKCVLMVPLRNSSSIHLSRIHVSYSIEKYRSGTAKTIELHISQDGVTWTSAGEMFLTQTVADEGDPEWTDDSPETTLVSGYLPCDLDQGDVLYLGWFYRSRIVSEAGNAQVLAIDDVVLKPGDRTILMMSSASAPIIPIEE